MIDQIQTVEDSQAHDSLPEYSQAHDSLPECCKLYFDTSTNSCLKCGLIDSLKDEYEVCQNFYKENDYYTFQTKKPQIGLKKYSKKEREIEEYYKQLNDQEQEEATTVSIHPPSVVTTTVKEKEEEHKHSIIIDEKYYIPNLKEKFLYIKSKEYNSKESTFENFYKIYTSFILDIPGNEDCIIGDKFYLNNTKKISYSEPCYIFEEKNKHLITVDSKTAIREKYTRNINFLKKVYSKYISYIEKSSSFISEDKKRNKSKSYIECFVLCILIHYYTFHCKDENLSECTETKENIIENCFGLKYNSQSKLSFKKKKIKSHIFSLIDLFNVNEVTMQTHLNDIVHNII